MKGVQREAVEDGLLAVNQGEPAVGRAAIAALPALILTGMMFGALGMLLSSTIKQLENFAGIMNFVIFPMFFASSALYPLWRLNESSPLLHDIGYAGARSRRKVRTILKDRLQPCLCATAPKGPGRYRCCRVQPSRERRSMAPA